MSENPIGATQASNQTPGFADALIRARQIASKLNVENNATETSGTTGGGASLKRPHSGFEESIIPTKKIPDQFSYNMMDGSVAEGQTTADLLMVPDKMVGLIIGRGGEQITRLQTESGAKIQMGQENNAMLERTCTITGSSMAVAHARSAIERIIASEGSMRGPMGDGGAHLVGGGGFFEMMVPGVKVGLIIGKGGESIKQLQEQSGAKIVIIQDGPEAAIEKPLRITGTPECVEIAKQLVIDIVNQLDDRDLFGGGRGRGRGRGGPVGPGMGRGMFVGRGGAPPMRGGRGGFMGGVPWGNSGGDYGPAGQHVECLPIPANKCGLVIGKGGENIKNINQISGAHCEVDKTAPADSREKNFIIRGSPDSVERAKSMIMEKLGPPMSGGPYGGNGGGPYGGPGGGQTASSWGGQGGPYGQPNQGPDPSQGQVNINPQTGQPDYSAQWAEYYRTLGMNREADSIEASYRNRSSAHGSQSASAAAANANGGGGSGTDYSAQWAEYYRSTGKIKEAEAIEAQMKAKAAAAASIGPGPAGGQYPPQYSQFYQGGQPQPGAPQSAFPGYGGYPNQSGYQGE